MDTLTLNPQTDTIMVGVVEHRHGSNAYAARTEAGLYGALAGYVADNWAEEVDARLSARGEQPLPIPTDPREAVTVYFEIVEDEFYTVSEATLAD